ncbi:methyl-accepting chemotaxis protein [Modestobacter italicus]|uniref:methyl-accepting chemotaxis protein n=1 Tax=Modestobacter italicus (strain DSM 44449 / CECT 9708 / BC 501) TaxID=2732864 RepID=UPI001E5ADEF6|nr:methyl-accepting chemotaxis protein [Modestobacter marinus]
MSALEVAGERTDRLLLTTTATGAASEADMMHDAVRADVLQALLSGSGDQYETAVRDLNDHAAALQAALVSVRDSGLGGGVVSAVDSVEADVNTYLSAGQQIAALAGRDREAALAAYPGFAAAFGGLEEALPVVGDAVAAEASDAAGSSADQRRTAVMAAVMVGIGGILLLGVLGWAVTRSVVRPLRRVRAIVLGLADGDLRGTTGLTSTDEVGSIATALETSMATMRDLLERIGDSSATLASATEELSATAQDMTRLAGESAAETSTVAQTAGQVLGNVQTVAAGTDQMGSSIREIAQNATDVARIAGRAVVRAEAATATVDKLGESSTRIAAVIKTITAIAEQTNLLALNATIEAARAGEAGKGFAVVANEVKDLAQETARATQDITARVEAIQADTTGAFGAIGDITAIIAQISDAQTTIAAAVEEQTATAAEMSRSITGAAAGVEQITERVNSVAEATGATTQAVTDARVAIDEAARLAAELNSAVGGFRF